MADAHCGYGIIQNISLTIGSDASILRRYHMRKLQTETLLPMKENNCVSSL